MLSKKVKNKILRVIGTHAILLQIFKKVILRLAHPDNTTGGKL